MRPQDRDGDRSPERLLEADRLTIRFGGLTAVKEFSLAMSRYELTGLIGPNGAGKTTIFNLLTGVYRPTSGSLSFQGRSLVGLPPWRIARAGVARTFQNIRTFPDPRMVLYSMMLIALMLTRPTGLFGSNEIRTWWREKRGGTGAGA